MNEIIVTTPDNLRQLLKDAVQDGVSSALRQIAQNIPHYMNDTQAAEYLGISPVTLRSWRMEKKGPKYHKFDKAVRYAKTDLDDWMKTREMLTIDSLEARHGTSC